MDYNKYVFVDYEYFQDIDVDIIDGKTKMILIIDEKQKKIPIEFIKITQSFGEAIEWLQIKKSKKSLYYFIVYFLGYYISNQKDKEFIIYSNNIDCDPLIEYLQSKNIDLKIMNNKNCKANKLYRKSYKPISSFLRKLSFLQKFCLSAAVLTVIIGLVAINIIYFKPTLVPVLATPISNKEDINRIVMRINQEGINPRISSTGLIKVKDQMTARSLRYILISEGLIPLPHGIDPLISDRDRWTITDYERNLNHQRSHTRMVTDQISALEDVDNANVIIVFPQDNLFLSEKNPVTVSLIITPKTGSDIRENRNKIIGIQKILKMSIEGLRDENIIIADNTGRVLNDFVY